MGNRHDVYIWDSQYKALPKDYQQAVEMAEKYATASDEPSDRLKRFAKEMAKYADAHQDELEENVFDFLDSIIYAVNEQTTIALVLDLPDDDWEQALQLTVEYATSRGLIVVAPELILAFMPHGKILPPEQKQVWQALCAGEHEDDEYVEDDTPNTVEVPQVEDKNLPKTLKQYHKWANNVFDMELSVFGFKRIEKPEWIGEDGTDSVFMREVEIGQQYIEFSYVGRNPYFGQNIYFRMVSNLGEEIYRLFPFSQSEVFTVFGTALNNIYDFTNCKVYKTSMSDVKREVKIIKANIISIFDGATTLKELDELMNGNTNPTFKRTHDKHYAPHRLIVARLADNPQFEQLAIELRTFARDAGNNNKPMREQWDNFVKYLREDIDPQTYHKKMAELKKQEQQAEAIRVNALQAQFNPKTPEELMNLASQWHDPKTHLIWQRCCIGQQWRNGEVIGNSQKLSWKEVLKLLEEPKHTGWRLPSLDELKTLRFTKRIGYITKNGFDYFELTQTNFYQWIVRLDEPLIVGVTNVDNPTIYDAPRVQDIKNDPNLKGYVRLVKSVS